MTLRNDVEISQIPNVRVKSLPGTLDLILMGLHRTIGYQPRRIERRVIKKFLIEREVHTRKYPKR